MVERRTTEQVAGAGVSYERYDLASARPGRDASEISAGAEVNIAGDGMAALSLSRRADEEEWRLLSRAPRPLSLTQETLARVEVTEHPPNRGAVLLWWRQPMQLC